MAPKVESVTTVKQWLAAHNLTALPLGYGDWFGVETTVAKASALFAANFSVFEHAGTGEKQVRTLEYSIPASLRGHLEVAHPLTRFVSPVCYQTASIHADTEFSFFDPRAQRSTIYAPAIEATVKSAAPNVDSSCSSLVTPVCLQELYGLPSGKPNATGVRSSLEPHSHRC
jgi:tripeptidyl-peptidase-1